MALIQCNFFSEVLELHTEMNVILPHRTAAHLKEKGSAFRYPVLYLLHGLSDDHTIWQRRTSIERYVDELGLAVVMPAVHRSFYTDMAKGLKYWTYISQELPAFINSTFPISTAREDTFVTGLSMGGYGSFKLALSCPERFAAAASLSGALDMEPAVTQDEDQAWRNECMRIFGDPAQFAGSQNDLLRLASQVAEAGRLGQPIPKLFMWCGTEDFLYDQNLSFERHARQLGLDLTVEYSPGDHQWIYWDEYIQKVIAWLPLRSRPAF